VASPEDKWKYFYIQCFQISARSLLYGRFPGFARLSFWYEKHVDEDEYGALVE
jgi:hypothetical protein